MSEIPTRIETRLVRRALREGLKERPGIGVGRDERTVRRYLRRNPEFFGQFASGLNELIKDYNNFVITNESRDLLMASARLKQKIPQLPTLEEMYGEFRGNRGSSVWLKNFVGAIRSMDQAMTQGEEIRSKNSTKDLLSLDLGASALFFHLSQTHPRAIAVGEVMHVYEETVLQDQTIRRGHEFRKDEIIDALIEMLIYNRQGSLLFPIVRNSWSMEESIAGLDWIRDYDHLSSALRAQAGCS